MNANKNAVQLRNLGVLRSNEPEPEGSAGVRVEPCQFETLLERAMEILSARAKTARSSGT
jgi:hypothetical protein